MPLTVRLNARTERALDALARVVVRRARTSSARRWSNLRLATAATRPVAAHTTPGSTSSVIVSTGTRDRKETTGEQFAALVREKARARRSR